MKPEPRKKKDKQPTASDSERKECDSWSSDTSSITEDQNWVQCENPDCLKWRIISKEDMEALGEDEKWFCHMNANVLFSSCDAPEEKYSSAHRLKQHGLSYKYSLLPQGSLVWAKLSGYCKWPSIICCQPGTSEYVILDNDGDPYSYHVEFLGTRHSVAWVYHTKIEAYGNLGKQEALESCSQPLSMVSMSRFKARGKKRKRACVTFKKKISLQLAEQLQAAIDEADDMVGLEGKDRLKICKVVCKESTEVEKERALKKVKERSEKPRRKKKKSGKSHEKSTSCSNSPSFLSESQKELSERKLTDFASKEDRLLADIQGLQTLEQEFLQDYGNFIKKKQTTITGPKWQGNVVSLFQLFMSVQEKGGFNVVCSDSRWKEVVIDCCDILPNKLHSSAASTAMLYYSRHLLQYEMYIKKCGSERSSPKPTQKVGKRKKEKKNKVCLIEKIPRATKKKRDKDDQVGLVVEDEAMKELREMEELLNELEENEEMNHDTNVRTSAEETLEKQSSMDFYFNDDSQNRYKNMDEFTQLLSQSQTMAREKTMGVDCEDLFADATLSEVAADVAPLDVLQKDSSDKDGLESCRSEEDLFAEMDKDEQLLQSLLDTT